MVRSRAIRRVHHVYAEATSPNEENPRVNGGFLWRYRWDLNPRWSCPHTCFRDMILRPLGHGTGKEFTRSRRPVMTPRVGSPSTGGHLQGSRHTHRSSSSPARPAGVPSTA